MYLTKDFWKNCNIKNLINHHFRNFYKGMMQVPNYLKKALVNTGQYLNKKQT